jgi:hypothetical protein
VKVDSMLHLANLAGNLDGLPFFMAIERGKIIEKTSKIWWLPGYPSSWTHIEELMEKK